MKRKSFLCFLCIVLFCAGVTGCSASGGKSGEAGKDSKEGTEENGKAMRMQEGALLSENTENNENNKAREAVPMLSLPEGISGSKAETGKLEPLENLIINYYDIPEEYLAQTFYYYNYVDLNEDGEDEIFAVIMGPYTSSPDGSSAVWVGEGDGELEVKGDFNLVNAPVIVSDQKTNEVHDLIIPYSGGGAENGYRVLTYSENFFPNVEDGETIETLEGITGKAIIANDLEKEADYGRAGLPLK